jgi:hypothetical protein
LSENNLNYKCVYSAELLTDTTTAEHVIPKGLGGKVASNNIMSSELNNDFSKYDKKLINRYYFVLHMINYFMAEKAKPGQMNIDLPGIKNGKFVLRDGAIVPRTGIQHVSIQNEKYILASDEYKIPLRFKNEEQKSQKMLYSEQKDEYGDSINFTETLICTEIDLALIKIAIGSLALYSLKEGKYDFRFYAEQAGSLMFKALKNDEKMSEFILNHSFGFQYEKTDYYLKLVRKVFGSVDLLSHYVIGFTNPATKTLDLAIVMFGREVFGVRIARNCNIPLAFILRNGINKTDYHDCKNFWIDDNTEIICTERKSILQRDIKDVEGHFYHQIESMNRLIVECAFLAETTSLDRFKQTVEIARSYWQADSENADYQNLGEYMALHIRNYFGRPFSNLNSHFIKNFDKFHQFGFDKDQIPENILIEAFETFVRIILELESNYGKPVNMFYRGFECDKNKI